VRAGPHAVHTPKLPEPTFYDTSFRIRLVLANKMPARQALSLSVRARYDYYQAFLSPPSPPPTTHTYAIIHPVAVLQRRSWNRPAFRTPLPPFLDCCFT
jgi:hypothetical protein